ncbi:MAG: hypothetical protein AVDCRST_MAG86-2652, partial [uncultured Truepera sp.]
GEGALHRGRRRRCGLLLRRALGLRSSHAGRGLRGARSGRPPTPRERDGWERRRVPAHSRWAATRAGGMEPHPTAVERRASRSGATSRRRAPGARRRRHRQ